MLQQIEGGDHFTPNSLQSSNTSYTNNTNSSLEFNNSTTSMLAPSPSFNNNNNNDNSYMHESMEEDEVDSGIADIAGYGNSVLTTATAAATDVITSKAPSPYDHLLSNIDSGE